MIGRRQLMTWQKRLKMVRVGIRALGSKEHPILVHIVPIRRCNLACGYCNEYDHTSAPVPTQVMLARLAHLSRLGTSIVCFSGGEPLLHPELDTLIQRSRSLGMVTEVLTNGYLLTRRRIERLNRAGLDRLQISIDNVSPDETSKKSLKVLDRKLVALAAHASFDVNINTVLGGSPAALAALTIARRARALGFSSTVGIIHDGDGELVPLGREETRVYRELLAESPPSFRMLTRFKDNLVRGASNDWRCRAGARYLYVCEEGLVHYCSQKRGQPGTPLARYGPADMDRAFHLSKPCAPHCTISCVHAVAPFDHFRGPQIDYSAPLPHQEHLVTLRAKRSVRRHELAAGTRPCPRVQ